MQLLTIVGGPRLIELKYALPECTGSRFEPVVPVSLTKLRQ